MKSRFIAVLISFSFLTLLAIGCGKEEHSGHSSMGQGGGGGDMNYEQQALKMEQDDLAKLKQGAHGDMKDQDFAKIHGGVDTKQDPNEVIAKVNGENIIRLELDRIYKMVKSKVGRSRQFYVENKILEDLVTQLLLKQFIKKQDIVVSQDRIEEELKKFRANLKDNPETKDKSLEQVLGEQGGSIDELRVALDISFSIDDYMEKTVPAEELGEYFTENIGAFNGETVTASHILINTTNIEKDEERLKEAKEKIEKLKVDLDNGADFAKLAENNSDCPSAKSGGNLGAFGRGEMVKAFTDTAFATEVNNVSGPIKTQFGYHIIKVTDKKAGKDVKLEDIKENVKIALYNKKTVSLIEGLKESADIQILLKETPQVAGSGHGSSYGGHGDASGGGHGGSFGASPHWNAPTDGPSSHGGASGASPHGDMSGGANPHGQKKTGESFSLTN